MREKCKICQCENILLWCFCMYTLADRIPEMNEAEFNQWLKENPDFSEKYQRAAVRKDYWDLWAGRANKTIAKLDSDIAALKQQAIDGGC